MRGLAAFGVVATHAPFNYVGAGPTLQPAAEAMLVHWRFHVPFFFAAAFIFFACSGSALETIAQRARRLLVPFAFWSVTYVLLHALKLDFTDGDVSRVWQDPIALLCGSASVHLYFLPMLFVGSVAAVVLWPLLARAPVIVPVALGFVSLGLSWYLRSTGNGFDQSTSTAFVRSFGDEQPGLLRVLLVWTAWIVTLLPFVCFGASIRRSVLPWLTAKPRPLAVVIFGAAFCAGIVFGRDLLEPNLNYIAIGLHAFLFSAALSPWIKNTAFSRALGRWSFGIYLAHVVPLQALQFVIATVWLPPSGGMSVGGILALAGTAFATSALVCALVERWGPDPLRSVFGLKLARSTQPARQTAPAHRVPPAPDALDFPEGAPAQFARIRR